MHAVAEGRQARSAARYATSASVIALPAAMVSIIAAGRHTVWWKSRSGESDRVATHGLFAVNGVDKRGSRFGPS